MVNQWLFGVTGVKRSKSQKIDINHLCVIPWSLDFSICISLRPSINVMGSKVNQGSFGVTRVKRSNSIKMLWINVISWSLYHANTIWAWAKKSICISLRPSINVMGSKVNQGSFGVTSVKRSNLPKWYESSVIILMHMHQLETLYQWHGVNGQSGVIWDHRRQKVKFTKNKSSMFHSMIIRLKHMHQLETLYQCHGVKGQSGPIWGHTSQEVKFNKNAINQCYIPSKHYSNGPVIASNGLLPAITDTADGSLPVSICYWYMYGCHFLPSSSEPLMGLYPAGYGITLLSSAPEKRDFLCMFWHSVT